LHRDPCSLWRVGDCVEGHHHVAPSGSPKELGSPIPSLGPLGTGASLYSRRCGQASTPHTTHENACGPNFERGLPRLLFGCLEAGISSTSSRLHRDLRALWRAEVALRGHHRMAPSGSPNESGLPGSSVSPLGTGASLCSRWCGQAFASPPDASGVPSFSPLLRGNRWNPHK
jgi:hypothetical protein